MAFAFDCETALIRPAFLAPTLVCVSSATPDRVGLAKHDTPGLERMLHAAFDEEPEIVGANTAFDAGVVIEAFPRLIPVVFRAYSESRVFDVQLVEQLIDIARGRLGGAFVNGVWRDKSYALAALVKLYTGKDRSFEKVDPNGWRLRYMELHGVPLDAWPTEAVEYSLDDARDTLDVWDLQQTDAALWRPDAAAQARAAFALHLMAAWGMKTHVEGIARLEALTVQRFTDLTAILVREGLVRPDGSRDTKKAKARLVAIYREAGIEIPITATGEEHRRKGTLADRADWASLSAEACEGSGDEILKLYAERTSLADIVQTHVPKLRAGLVTPIQARYGLAETGRITCTEGSKGPTNGYQLSNVRTFSGIRECFKARNGFAYGDADFTGLELSTVAEACTVIVGWSRLGDAIKAGVDPHLALGADLLEPPISYDEAKRRKHEKAVKEARQLAKVANFGFPGGLGAKGFVAYARQKGVRITIERATEVRDAWLARWDEFGPYFLHVEGLCEGTGAAEVVQLYTGRIRGLTPYTAACNGYFQGLGADGAKAALWEVTRRCYDPTMRSILLGSRPVNFVHDQIIAEHPEPIAAECATEMGRVMVEACNRFLPNVPVKCEPHLSRTWSKDYSPIYDAPSGGRLVIFDDARAERRPVWHGDGQPMDWDEYEREHAA